MVEMARSISASARIGQGTVIGHGVVIAAGVMVGKHCRIGHHVVIHQGVVIGDDVRIDDHATIGKQPLRAANSVTTKDTVQPPARIGNCCLIGTGAVIYAGSNLGEAVMVADLATIREDVLVGDGTIVGRGVAVENCCRIGRYCKLETNAYITAYSQLDDRVFVAPGVLTSNDNYLGRTEERKEHYRGLTARRGSRIGVGAVVLPGKVLGEEAVIGAGAVVTRDADAGQIHCGLPARPFRAVPPEQMLDAQADVNAIGSVEPESKPVDGRYDGSLAGAART